MALSSSLTLTLLERSYPSGHSVYILKANKASWNFVGQGREGEEREVQIQKREKRSCI